MSAKARSSTPARGHGVALSASAGKSAEHATAKVIGEKSDEAPLATDTKDCKKAETKRGSFVMQEVWSAASMLLPSIYIHHAGGAFAEVSQQPEKIWLMAFATYAHCLASAIYHLQCAYNSGTDFNHFRSPTRTADISLIHVCCYTYGVALSGGSYILDVISLSANTVCVASLLWRCFVGKASTPQDSFRALGCVLIYSAAMPLRSDWQNYAGLMLSYAIGGFFWQKSAKFNGWGHGLFHVMLVPCTHFVLRSAAIA